MDNGDGTDWKRFKEGSIGRKEPWYSYLAKARPGAEIKIVIPPTAGKAVANVCTFANRVSYAAVPLAIGIDAFRVGASVNEDCNNGTTRNTVETVASVAGGWGGGFAGALGGAAAGTAIFPGIGTVVGGIIGCLGGGIGGSLGASAAAEVIGDAVDYDVEEWVCDKCGKKFKVHKYKGEKRRLCPNCSKQFGS